MNEARLEFRNESTGWRIANRNEWKIHNLCKEKIMRHLVWVLCLSKFPNTTADTAMIPLPFEPLLLSFYLAVPRWGFGETNGFVQPTWLLESAWDCISLPRILNACLVNSQPLNPRSPFATLFISQEKFNRCTNFAIFCSDVKKEELAVSAETGRSQPGQPIGQNFALGELLLDQALAERIPLLQPCSF